ncbi:MAG: translation initiation factor [Gaiellales bacterium]|nr:translation initiation factor [Gaiellales bacterium]
MFPAEGEIGLDTDRDWALDLRPRRRFDQRPQEPTTRINDAIRVPQVRLIGADGEQIGIKSTDEALKYAWDANLDLVEVAPDAKPPVCRVMDYSKYKYEQEQKAKLARKHQSTITIKEIKLRPKIDPHDYATKKGHVIRFLKNRDKVKVTIMFRGREMTHPDRGRVLLLRLAEEVQDLGIVESAPLQDGRNMVMMLAPHKNVLAPAAGGEGSPQTEQPKAEPSAAPPAAETPAVVEAPAVETPAVEAPAVVEAPVTEEPAKEPEPAVEEPKAEPAAEEPKAEPKPAAKKPAAKAPAKAAAKPKAPARKAAAPKTAAAKSTTTKKTTKKTTENESQTAATPADAET